MKKAKISLKQKQRLLKRLKTASKFKSGFDSLGSYTGINADNPFEEPIQDADDL